MRVGVISDTHAKADLTKKALLKLKELRIEYLIHAGDIGSEEILSLMERMEVPYTAVFGNNDFHLRGLERRYNLFLEPHYFKIEDRVVKLMHMPYYLTPDSDIIIYGHLHKFQLEFIKGRVFLNPGEICARNKPYSEFAILDIIGDGYAVEYFYRHVDSREWSFKREVLKGG